MKRFLVLMLLLSCKNVGSEPVACTEFEKYFGPRGSWELEKVFQWKKCSDGNVRDLSCTQEKVASPYTCKCLFGPRIDAGELGQEPLDRRRASHDKKFEFEGTLPKNEEEARAFANARCGWQMSVLR